MKTSLAAIVAVIVATAVTLSCGAKTSVMSRALVAHGANCLDGVAQGALPDDGVDDALAISAALALGDVCLQSGTYTARKHGRYSIRVPSGRVLRGAGPSTRIIMDGDGGNGAWTGIGVSGTDTLVADLFASAEATYNTEEQTHVIGVEGPSVGARLVNVVVSNPVRLKPDGSPWPGGDCVRLLGQPGAVVKGTVFVGPVFRRCDRTGLQIQRETERTLVTGASFEDTGDQDIDIEATGSGRVNGVTVQGSTFTGGQQGDYAVAVQCSTGTCSNVTIVGSVFDGRGLYTFNTDGMTFAANVVRHTARGPEPNPTIWVSKTARHAAFTGNVITRTGVAGPIFGVKDHNSGFARHVSIRSNEIVQGTSWAVFHYRGAQHLMFEKNTVHRSVEGKLTRAETSSLVPYDIVVRDNHLTGLFSAPLSEGPPGPLAALSGVNDDVVPSAP